MPMAGPLAGAGSDSEDFDLSAPPAAPPARSLRSLALPAAALLLLAGAALALAPGRPGAPAAGPLRRRAPGPEEEAWTGLAEAAPGAGEAGYTSVAGGALETCSTDGTALTGFTRDGRCVDSGDDDAGSHHICIRMKPDFCTVTGQPNWCVTKMQCMGENGKCPIGNWCVCQWAFATYLQMAGGCDKIVDLKCDATNMAAFKAYQRSDEPAHREALACIRRKCNLA